jgi:hypothetical protein
MAVSVSMPAVLRFALTPEFGLVRRSGSNLSSVPERGPGTDTPSMAKPPCQLRWHRITLGGCRLQGLARGLNLNYSLSDSVKRSHEGC